jgi:hypothetical protein
MLGGGVRRWCGVVSSSSKIVSFDGVAQRGLGDGSEMMDMRRAVALSGVMKSLIKLLHRPCSEHGFAEDIGVTYVACTCVRRFYTQGISPVLHCYRKMLVFFYYYIPTLTEYCKELFGIM